MLDCVLISSDDEFRRLTNDLVRQPNVNARIVLDLQKAAHEIPRDALGRILSANPRVVFVDLGGSTTGMRVIQALSHEAPEIALIAAGPQLSAEALLEVMRAGAGEYLPRPLSHADAVDAFGRTRRKLAPTGQEGPVQRGKLTTVFSAKGGTGVSTIAANLALAVRQVVKEDTILLDMAPALGTAPLLLGIQPRYSYLDVVSNFHRIDVELLRSFLEEHESGLFVLASPPVVEDAAGLTTDQALGLVRLCRRHFAHVIVDAGNTLADSALAALAESDERVVVVTPELPTLRNLRSAMELLRVPSMNGHQPPRVVLNQFREDSGVSAKDVETSLGHAVDTVLHSDESAIMQSINLAEPLVLSSKSRFGREIMRLGVAVAGPEYEQAARGGVFGNLLRPFRRPKPAPEEAS